MSVFTKLGNDVASPVNADGTPRKPVPQDFQVWMTEVESLVTAVATGGGLIIQGAANLPLLLNYPSLTMAWVVDPDPNLSGIYQKQGASGSGSWLRVLDLPYSFIKATNAGAGTANAIVATTSIPIPVADGGALINVNITADNTGAATVSFNGGPALNIISSSGNAMQAGYLTAGMQIAGFKVGSDFRLLSETATAAMVAIAEQAVLDAQAAAQAAQDAMSSVVPNIFPTKAEAEAYAPAVAPDFINLAGYATAGDGGGAQYKKVAVEPTHAGKFSITLADAVTVVWYEIAEDVIRPEMLGAFIGNVDALLRTTFDVARAIGANVRLRKGAHTLTAATAIDISGVDDFEIPKGCILDASASTTLTLFSATGSKTLLQSAQSIAIGAGARTMTGVATALERGDTILVSSIEAHPNSYRPEYFKGTRTYVDSVVYGVAFDAQTANFTLGSTVTGQTSGATGIIATMTDGGATGNLGLREVVGTFQDNEIITDSGGGSATANIPSGPTGTVRFFPQIDFSYTNSAYIWKANENKIKVHGGGLVKGNPLVNVAGFVFDLCDAEVNVRLKYFSQAGVRFEASKGIVYRSDIRYSYRPTNSNYCVAVSDLSDVYISDCFMTGARHAVTVGGGTWTQADSGGAPAAAAYPSTCTVNGGTYGGSRSSADFTNDPSLEIGAIDAHGIAKALTVTGCTIYGGCKIAPSESVVITGNTIYHRNYSPCELVDTNSYDWGSVLFSNNKCIFIGDEDLVSSPTSRPTFISGGSSVFFKELVATGNSFEARGAYTGPHNALFIRNARHVVFKNNRAIIPLAAATADVRCDIYVYETADISDNEFDGIAVRVMPNADGMTLPCTASVTNNDIRKAGGTGAGLAFIKNSLVPAGKFRHVSAIDNEVVEANGAGISASSEILLSYHLEGNRARNCNVGASAASTIGSGFILLRINATTDPIRKLVLLNNTALSDGLFGGTHVNGFQMLTGTSITTQVIMKGNSSYGHSNLAMTDMAVAGNVVVEQSGNTGLADYIVATTGAKFKYDGAAWVAA